jgi:hypothetical protein
VSEPTTVAPRVGVAAGPGAGGEGPERLVPHGGDGVGRSERAGGVVRVGAPSWRAGLDGEMAAVEREVGLVHPPGRLLGGDEGDGFAAAVGEHDTGGVDPHGVGQHPLAMGGIRVSTDDVEVGGEQGGDGGGVGVERDRQVEDVAGVDAQAGGDGDHVTAVGGRGRHGRGWGGHRRERRPVRARAMP